MFDNSKLKKIGSVWLFVLPAFIPLMVFWIYPILKSLYISFTDWDYMSPTYNFVFLDNFIKLFKDSRFYEALGTTVWFSIGTLFPTIAGGLLLALLLRKTFRGSGFSNSFFFAVDNSDCCGVYRVDMDIQSRQRTCKCGVKIFSSSCIAMDK